MTWVKLDDGFATHPKVIGLSNQAFRLFVMALCYSAQHQTDGILPVGYMGRRHEQELVAADLLEVHEKATRIHDFLDYNLSKSEWQELSQKRSKAGSKGAAKRWQADSKPLADPTRPDSTPTTSKAPTGNPVTEDQIYLAGRLEEQHGRLLKPPSIQKLNSQYGTPAVVSAMRKLHGFPPEDPVLDVYAYVESICALEATA